jgi:hypothetical protein
LFGNLDVLSGNLNHAEAFPEHAPALFFDSNIVETVGSKIALGYFCLGGWELHLVLKHQDKQCTKDMCTSWFLDPLDTFNFALSVPQNTLSKNQFHCLH